MEIDICNAIRAEVAGIAKTGLPLDAFPAQLQGTIHNLAIYENFNIEFTACAMLSAVASAIGNSLAVNIKGEWSTSPILYMMLVGRPGLGKTPPLAYCYAPMRARDREELCRYLRRCEELEEAAAKGRGEGGPGFKAPVLVKSVVSDFTPESLVSVHSNNPRGITVLVDEILALFKSAGRYSKNNVLNEMLLSAWSAQPIDCVRKTEKKPTFVERPCIGIVGSIQTQLMDEIFSREYTANGLADRFLFVYPKDQHLNPWVLEADSSTPHDMSAKWGTYMGKIFSLPCDTGEGGKVGTRILQMSDDARRCFYDWYNSIITDLNGIDDDLLIESRKTKLCCVAARLALVLQVMRWAAGESHLQHVDHDSVRGAIRLVDYFEDSYHRIRDKFVMLDGRPKKDWLSNLPDTFSTFEAVKEGRLIGVSESTVKHSLGRLAEKQDRIKKVAQGRYEKVHATAQDALCTSALSDPAINDSVTSDAVLESESAQSAIVQSANDDAACTNAGEEGG